MIDFYVRKEDKPKRCKDCPLLNDYDDCVLQTEEQNWAVETFEELYRNCPLLTVERDAE